MDVVTFIWHDAAIIEKSKIGVSAPSLIKANIFDYSYFLFKVARCLIF